MSKFSKIKTELAKILISLSEVKSDKGILNIDGEIAEGVNVTVVDEEGNSKPVEDGDYVLEDGRTLSVVEGKISSIAEKQAEEEKPAEEEKAEEETPAEEAPAEEKPAEESPAEEVEDAAEEMKDIAEAIAAIGDRLTGLEGEMKKCFEGLAKCNEKMSATPAAQSFESEMKTSIQGNSPQIDRIKKMFELN